MASPIVRLALAHWPAAAVLIDEHGHIDAGNRAAAKLFGYHRGELRDVALDELIPAWRPLDPREAPARRRRATGHRHDGSTFALRFIQLPVEVPETRCTLVAIRPRAQLNGVVFPRGRAGCGGDGRDLARVRTAERSRAGSSSDVYRR